MHRVRVYFESLKKNPDETIQCIKQKHFVMSRRTKGRGYFHLPGYHV